MARSASDSEANATTQSTNASDIDEDDDDDVVCDEVEERDEDEDDEVDVDNDVATELDDNKGREMRSSEWCDRGTRAACRSATTPARDAPAGTPRKTTRHRGVTTTTTTTLLSSPSPSPVSNSTRQVEEVDVPLSASDCAAMRVVATGHDRCSARRATGTRPW